MTTHSSELYCVIDAWDDVGEDRYGPHTSFHKNGKPKSAGWRDGTSHIGLWTYWHCNGTMAEQGYHDRDGDRVGIWQEWHPTGEKRSTTRYHAEGGAMDRKLFYRNGELEAFIEFGAFGHPVLERTWYPDGNVAKVETHKAPNRLR